MSTLVISTLTNLTKVQLSGLNKCDYAMTSSCPVLFELTYKSGKISIKLQLQVLRFSIRNTLRSKFYSMESASQNLTLEELEMLQELKQKVEKLNLASKQVVLIYNAIEETNVRMERAEKHDRRAFIHTLDMKLLTLKGIISVFGTYCDKLYQEITSLHNTLIQRVVIEPQAYIAESDVEESDMEESDL